MSLKSGASVVVLDSSGGAKRSMSVNDPKPKGKEAGDAEEGAGVGPRGSAESEKDAESVRKSDSHADVGLASERKEDVGAPEVRR